MLRILSLMIIGLLFISSCTTKTVENIPPATVAPTEPVNNSNSTNVTEVMILQKPITVFTPRLENLTVYVLDVGGTAIIIQYKNNSVLVDAGLETDSQKVLKALRDLGISNLDYIFATNTQPKNIGGMPYIILRTEPSNYIEGIPTHINETVRIDKVERIKNDKTIFIEDIAINVLVGYDDGFGFSSNLDDNSLVIKVTYGSSDILLMSECSLDCEEKIKNDGVQADVIKISNSCDATSLTFLQDVNPTWAIVSGEHEDFCPNVIDRFNNLNIPVFMTKDKGDIFVTTDGLDFKIDWNKE